MKYCHQYHTRHSAGFVFLPYKWRMALGYMHSIKAIHAPKYKSTAEATPISYVTTASLTTLKMQNWHNEPRISVHKYSC